MIKPPRETSKRVENSIRECWARLAKLQFKEAAKAVPLIAGNETSMRGLVIDDVKLPTIVEQRMAKVEAYLELAGAEATKSYFNAYVD